MQPEKQMPAIDDIMTPPAKDELGQARINLSPVTENVVFEAQSGNGRWDANTFEVSRDGLANYWFIPPAHGDISYCVVHCNGSGPAYVISNQYGGCEYHELCNADLELLAFLHVYRGGGATKTYTPAPGWEVRSVKRSSNIVKRGVTIGDIWSFSMIDRRVTQPTVTTKFIRIGGTPKLTVTMEDDGDTPYE